MIKVIMGIRFYLSDRKFNAESCLQIILLPCTVQAQNKDILLKNIYGKYTLQNGCSSNR